VSHNQTVKSHNNTGTWYYNF